MLEASFQADLAQHLQVLHVEFNIEGSGMQYQPGDSVGLLPHNSPELVQGVLQHLGQDGSQVFSIASTSGDDSKLLQHLHWPCSLQHALSVGCDLTSIPRLVTALTSIPRLAMALTSIPRSITALQAVIAECEFREYL